MKKLTFIFLASLLVGACAKKNDNPVADVKQAAIDKDLQAKTFVADCSLKPIEGLLTGIMTGGQSSLKAELTTYDFNGANVTRTTRIYNTTDCSGDPAVSFEERGNFRIESDPNKKSNDGGRNIDLNYKSLKVKIETPAGATAANAIKLCGASDWAAKQSRDVSSHSKDLTCYGAALPRNIYNIYRVDAGTLYLGTTAKSANTPKDRPARLDRVDKYKSH